MPDPKGINWTKKRVALLGTEPDGRIANRLGISRSQVQRQRTFRGIPCGDKRRYTTKEEAAIKSAVEKLAKKLRRTPSAIARKICDLYF